MGKLTPRLWGHAAMLLFSALVAGSFSLGAQVANDIAPLALNAVRFWLAASLIGLALFAGTGIPRGAFRSSWRYAVLGGLFGTYFVLMFEGLKTAEPVSTAAVFTLTPVLSAFFGWVLLRQVTTPRMAVALAIGACGAVWVIFRADIDALRAFEIGRGEMIFFVGCICHAVYTPMVRKLNKGEPVLVFTFGTLVGGGVVLTLFGARDLVSTSWGTLPPMVWFTLGYVVIFASAASVWLLQTATLRLPSAKVMAYTYLVPSWVIVWEAAQGKPLPSVWVLGGVVLTMTALALLLRDEDAHR